MRDRSSRPGGPLTPIFQMRLIEVQSWPLPPPAAPASGRRGEEVLDRWPGPPAPPVSGHRTTCPRPLNSYPPARGPREAHRGRTSSPHLASRSLSSPALGPSPLGRGFSSRPVQPCQGPSGKQNRTARAGCSLLPPCGGEGWRGDLGYLVGPERGLSSPLQVRAAGLKPTSPDSQT